MKVLILGITGMLGNTMLRYLSRFPELEIWGTARSEKAGNFFETALQSSIITGIDVLNHDSLVQTFAKVQPDIVINCVGLIKQLAECNDPLTTLPINSLLPHRLSALCAATGARLIHVSTDCVFSGSRGRYKETDFPDANDLYGRSKLLGEVTESTHAITLRTSLIGHELGSHFSLVDWFLSQQDTVKGYTKAIFSGLPTVEFCRVIREHVLPRPELHGLYQVVAAPVDKHALLHLIAQAYDKKIEILPDDKVQIDRSLDGERFRMATGYEAPPWPDLIQRMQQFR